MEGFVLEDAEPSLQPAEAAKKGDVSLVYRREQEKAWCSVLYIRKPLVDLQAKLDGFIADGSNKSRCYIRGPPGSGKTCFLYLWARRYSVLNQKRVLIVQFREKDSCFIWIRERDGSLYKMDEAIASSKLGAAVDDVITKNKYAKAPFDLCIHDGAIDKLRLCSEMLSTLNTAVTNGVFARVIHVTSLAFSLSTGGQLLSGDGPVLRLSLDSWSEETYLEAVRCTEFINAMETNRGPFSQDLEQALSKDSEADNSDEKDSEDVSNDDKGKIVEEVVTEKYFFAGGSARFMFQFSLHDLREELDIRMGAVDRNEWQYFAQNAVASGTPSAVNTLMQQFNLRCSPVSKYVLIHAYNYCREQLVMSVRAAAVSSGNPTLKGWAFELEQIHLIRTSLNSRDPDIKYVTNGNGWSFRPTSEVEFDESEFQSYTCAPGSPIVIWCLKWNQGCFDVAFFMNATLVTVQFTVSEKHSLKPQYIRQLRQALLDKKETVNKVLHVGVREVDWQELEFKTDTRGTGRQVNEEAAEFEIEVCRSPQLKEIAGVDAEFNFTGTSSLMRSEKMYPLGRKRIRADPGEGHH
jgi:hypothetical protein